MIWQQGYRVSRAAFYVAFELRDKYLPSRFNGDICDNL